MYYIILLPFHQSLEMYGKYRPAGRKTADTKFKAAENAAKFTVACAETLTVSVLKDL